MHTYITYIHNYIHYIHTYMHTLSPLNLDYFSNVFGVHIFSLWSMRDYIYLMYQLVMIK